MGDLEDLSPPFEVPRPRPQLAVGTTERHLMYLDRFRQWSNGASFYVTLMHPTRRPGRLDSGDISGIYPDFREVSHRPEDLVCVTLNTPRGLQFVSTQSAALQNASRQRMHLLSAQSDAWRDEASYWVPQERCEHLVSYSVEWSGGHLSVSGLVSPS